MFGFVDWNNTDEKYAHKACKGLFFKESFLNLQRLPENSPNENGTLSTPSPYFSNRVSQPAKCAEEYKTEFAI